MFGIWQSLNMNRLPWETLHGVTKRQLGRQNFIIPRFGSQHFSEPLVVVRNFVYLPSSSDLLLRVAATNRQPQSWLQLVERSPFTKTFEVTNAPHLTVDPRFEIIHTGNDLASSPVTPWQSPYKQSFTSQMFLTRFYVWDYRQNISIPQ